MKIKTKTIKIDEKDWFNIDEEIDPKLVVTDTKELELLILSIILLMFSIIFPL